jgi:hypothetical protein
MTYATSNPPIKVTNGVGSAQELWMYASTDVHTTVAGADYFSNGHALGMKVNDVVLVTKTSATIGSTLHTVTAVTTDGAATVSSAILA